jgi:RNA polymerase sigma factor (sigma-70 family)
MLERFVTERDESAFATLVERHGPMVLEVCLRVLQDAHEAEDACQATFLVLARKAGSLGRPELLANWLYGVAYRAARKTQRQAIRYRAHAKKGAAMQATDLTAEVIWKDVRPVIDEELDRLPDKFRAVVVLCYLEGVKAEDAARQLGCARGTILSRLARAREQLRKRLARRGVMLSAGFLGLLLARNAAASIAMSPTFTLATAKAASAFALNRTIPANVTTQRVDKIAKGVLAGMLFASLRVGLVCLIVAGAAILVVATAVRLRLGATSQDPIVDMERERLAAGTRASIQDTENLRGTWRLVEYVSAGKEFVPDEIKNWSWTIEGDGFTMIGCHNDPANPQPMKNAQNEVMQFHFRLDAATFPKSVDVSVGRSPCWVGIYELDRDTFRVCTVKANSPRPTGFAPDGNNIVWVFKRGPAEKEDVHPDK